MGIYERAEEVLARSHYSRHGVARLLTSISTGFSDCSLHLYFVLKEYLQVTMGKK